MTYEIKAQILAEQATVACRDDVPEPSVGPWLAGVYAALTRYLEHLQVSRPTEVAIAPGRPVLTPAN